MLFLSKVVGVRPAVCVAALVGILMMTGCGSSSSSDKVTAIPAFSPAGGTYNTSQTVTITDATSGAVLYCTTDGTTPTTSSPQCSQPTTVFKTEFLQAIAVAPGMAPSAVASAGYTINLSAAATPTFSPAGGTYSAAQMVSISDTTAGANIFYTLDGTIPTASSTLYTGPITVSSTETISAIAVASGLSNSGVASASYVINPFTAAPTFSPAGGTYSSAQTVTISDTTSGATIYYTVDGSAPTTFSTQYSGPITVSQTETFNAIAVATGYANSAVATAVYTISQATATPTFSPVGGTYSSAQTVTISDTTSGATIYYTANGTTPTTSSTQYSGPITVSQTETFNAIAVATGYANSAVATAAYTISSASVASPTFSPVAGTYTSPQTVTISDATSGTTIYYAVDGSTPTTSSTQYSTPIAVSATETIKAIAVTSGGGSSAVATAAYTISSSVPTLSGKVFSGTVPVNGAQVQLYTAGQSGYGSAATVVATAPVAVTTDSSGAFTFNYSCPASPGDLLYVIASGGDAGSGANSSLKLMAALGSCNSLSSSQIVVNEVTTVASAYALSAFMTTAPNVGSSSTNYQGLVNAFNTVSNLVNISTGQALSMTPAYTAANPVPYLNSSTVPQARINSLANILNVCVNSNGSGCPNLFSIATVPGNAPADSLQAILNIAQNPGIGTNPANPTLFNLVTATPFQPALSVGPGDWTLALTFTGAGLGVAPPTSTSTVHNTALAIDVNGNVWVTAWFDTTALFAEFSSLGASLTPNTTQSTSTPSSVTYGGYQPAFTIPIQPSTLAIDPSGNLWTGGAFFGASGLGEISSNLELVQSGLTTLNNALSMTIDGSGNVWLFEFQSGLHEYDNAGNESSPTAGWTGAPSNPPNDQFGSLSQLVFDSKGNLWAEDNIGFGDLFQISSTGTILADPYYFSGGAFTPIAANSSGDIYACGTTGGQSLDVLNAGSQSIASSYPIPTGRGCGGQLVVDGLGNIFAITGGTAASATIDEFTIKNAAFSTISPVTTGYTGTSNGEAITINPDPSVTPPIATQAGTLPSSGVAGAALDGSGNLWILNPNTGAAASSPGNVLVEFIGIGAPVVTPTSLGFQNTPANPGQRP